MNNQNIFSFPSLLDSLFRVSKEEKLRRDISLLLVGQTFKEAKPQLTQFLRKSGIVPYFHEVEIQGIYTVEISFQDLPYAISCQRKKILWWHSWCTRILL